MIKDRIIQLIENKGLPKEIFYKKIGVTSANFRGKAKESDVGSITIAKIFSEIPDANLKWLITGEGEILDNNISKMKKEQDNEYKELAESRKEIIELQKEKIQNLEKEIAKFKKAQEPTLHSRMASESNLELGESKEK